ncbi:hypothetical protein [Halobacillus sp. K22]|uniref:hypothetical protein n=1 Tax=Halobacillus sp. K22 TaxID=3457431 RepID=UPI003FCDC366
MKQWQSKQLPPVLRQSLTEWVGRTAAELSNLSEKEAVFIKMKAILDLSGIQNESQIKTVSAQEKMTAPENSLKSLLLSSMNDTNSSIRTETAKKMIQMLNGNAADSTPGNESECTDVSSVFRKYNRLRE